MATAKTKTTKTDDRSPADVMEQRIVRNSKFPNRMRLHAMPKSWDFPMTAELLAAYEGYVTEKKVLYVVTRKRSGEIKTRNIATKRDAQRFAAVEKKIVRLLIAEFASYVRGTQQVYKNEYAKAKSLARKAKEAEARAIKLESDYALMQETLESLRVC